LKIDTINCYKIHFFREEIWN